MRSPRGNRHSAGTAINTELLKSMGDRSPKDNQKKSSQKSAAASSSAAKKSQAIADKKAVPGKKK